MESALWHPYLAWLLPVTVLGLPMLLGEAARRRRRRDALLRDRVLALFEGRGETRGMIGVHVSGSLFSRRVTVTLSTAHCANALVWNVIVHELDALPPSTRVVVECLHGSHRSLEVRAPHLLTVWRGAASGGG